MIMPGFRFPRYANHLRSGLLLFCLVLPIYTVAIVWYGFSPQTTDVGYAPRQPVPFSHAVHAGELGIDCRYCHDTVERTARASVPSTESCMTCHQTILADSENLAQVRRSFELGVPIEWLRVHDLPDYVYFDHSAHVARGIGCASCHGPVDRMEVVSQVKTLSMGWCLDCHRDPEPHVRPQEAITDMGWTLGAAGGTDIGALTRPHHLNPSLDCSTCHR